MTIYNDQVQRYINHLFVKQDPALQQVWEDTPKRGLPAISVKPEEGRFLQFLAWTCQATKALEIGTLGGYSGIWISRGLAPGGRLITLEKEEKHAEVAREHFELAGVSERVEIRVGDAHQLLAQLVDESPFDFIFIDAEKPGYRDYYEWAMENTRLGGVIAAHNAFRKGSVAGLGEEDEWTQVMLSFNQMVAEDTRVISTIFPAGDGTIIATKVW